MSGMQISFKGIRTMSSKLRQLKADIRRRGLVAVRVGNEFLISKMIPVTPMRTGRLRKSFENHVSAGAYAVYGKIENTAPYASYVHEMPEATNWTTPGTGPKFMERPMDENQREVLRIIANLMRF